MLKPLAKKIIIQFHHNQDKLYFFNCKVIESFDVATVLMKSVVASSKEDASERFKKYFENHYEFSPKDFIVRLDPKLTRKDVE